MNSLTTHNPIALSYLMDETLYLDRDVKNENVPLQDAPLLDFLGGNDKNILFLVHQMNFEYFSDEAKNAFLKTLSALKLLLKDVAVFNWAKRQDLSFEAIQEFFLPKICITLGEGWWDDVIPLNMVVKKDEFSVLNTYGFEEMLQDDEKKRAFWKSMKELEFDR